jgi:type IV pilus assembly protein PilA
MNRTSSLSTARRGSNLLSRPNRTRPRPNGFTLMELLIVMAIITILAMLAISSIGAYTKRADTLSAINSVQKIVQAQMMYSDSYPANGFACTLQALGGDPSSGPPSLTSAQLLPPDLASGFKQGYMFTLTCKDKVTANGADRFNSYVITAVPQTVGKTGDRGFCSDETGIIKYDPAGGANCSQNLQ